VLPSSDIEIVAWAIDPVRYTERFYLSSYGNNLRFTDVL
jgi:hypothetical protein